MIMLIMSNPIVCINTSMDFQKLKLSRKKKHSFHNKHIYKQVTDILKFYEVLFCTICKVFFCLLKTVIILNSPYMHKTLLTLGNEK